MADSSRSVDAQELVNAAEIGRRLELTAERIRQLARAGRLPKPLGRVGRNLVWAWEDVAAWAIAEGRLEPSAHRPIRRAPTIWLDTEPVHRRLVTDSILAWDDVGSIAHVRIWEPDSVSHAWPVVILGNLDDNEGMSVTNQIERVADAVLDRWLGERGLNADWIEYYPHGALQEGDSEFRVVSFEIAPVPQEEYLAHPRPGRLSRPIWYEITRRQVETLVCDAVPIFDPGTYTSVNVEALARAGSSNGPIEVVWDPYNAGDHAAAVTAIGEQLDASPKCPDAPMLRRVAHVLSASFLATQKETVEEIQDQSRDRPVRKVPPTVPPDVQVKVEEWATTEELYDAIEAPGGLRSAVLEVREWLHGHDPQSAQQLLPGRQGFAWSEPWMAGGTEVGERPRCDGNPLTAGMKLADQMMSIRLWREDAGFRDSDHPLWAPSTAMSANGGHTSRYLETVSWFGPVEGDEGRLARLAHRLAADEGDRRFGYDPWGRAVLHALDAGLVLVEWPLVPPASPLPLQARIVATNDSPNGPVFIELPDGRLDLVCATPSTVNPPSFTFGYYGAGPNNLASGIFYLLGGKPRVRGRHSEEEEAARERLLPRIAEAEDSLELALADLRDEVKDLLP